MALTTGNIFGIFFIFQCVTQCIHFPVIWQKEKRSLCDRPDFFCISGSVPPFYREVYDIICPNQEHVDHDMFVKLLVKSSLPKATLTQVRLISLIVQES